jgi:hypothetical protein
MVKIKENFLSRILGDENFYSQLCNEKAGTSSQWWANLDQAPEDLDKNIFRDLSPTPKP